MGSYENIVKIEEMKKKVDEGDFLSAQKVLDTIEIKKIKNVSDLNLIAEVYSQNERFEEAKDLYLKLYDKTKSRKSLFQLIEALIKLNNTEDAQYYLLQYEKISPEDFYNYVFHYKIDKIKGESFEHLIEILIELKKMEYTEKWAYELAKLYYKAGREEECIRECSDIVLWFGEGTYVEKARILRSYYSGETDKENIMEEIKRRAEVVSSHNDYNGQDAVERIDSKEDYLASEDSYVLEGTLYNDEDFMVHEDNEEFVDDLKKDVQNILTGAQAEQAEQAEEAAYGYSNTYAEEEEPSYQEEEPQYQEKEPSYRMEKTYYEEGSEAYEDTDAFRKKSENTYNVNVNSDQRTEKEKAGEEVENTIYRLLKEEDVNDEDKKLKQIAKNFQIDSEEVFGNFLHVLSIKKQLVKSLEMIINDRNKNLLMIITGTVGSGKTTLAKDIALFLYKAGKLKSSKVAKIKADKLNTVDIMSKKETLKDCCLVVENASELKRRTIESLLELSGNLPGDIAVVFEENKKNMNKLFRECPKLMDLLKNRIHLPQYTQEDLVGFAYACLKQKDYQLDHKADQILKNKTSQIVKQSEPHEYLEQIYNMMQSAVEATDLRTGKQLSDLAKQGRLKDVEILTVLAEDFQN